MTHVPFGTCTACNSTEPSLTVAPLCHSPCLAARRHTEFGVPKPPMPPLRTNTSAAPIGSAAPRALGARTRSKPLPRARQGRGRTPGVAPAAVAEAGATLAPAVAPNDGDLRCGVPATDRDADADPRAQDISGTTTATTAAVTVADLDQKAIMHAISTWEHPSLVSPADRSEIRMCQRVGHFGRSHPDTPRVAPAVSRTVRRDRPIWMDHCCWDAWWR